MQSVGVGGLCHAQLCPQTGDGPAEARRLYIFHDRDLLLKTQLPQDPDKREAQPGSTQHQIALVGMWGGAHGGGGDGLKRHHCGWQPFWLQGAKGPVITAGGGWVGWEGSVLEGVGQEPLANAL